MDFYLSPHLLLHFALLYFRFVQDFQSADEAAALFFGEIDTTEFAFAERLSYLEHAKVELLASSGGLCLEWVGEALGEDAFL